MNLLELFVDEWLATVCLNPYEFKFTERFCSEEIQLNICFESDEDAFLFRIQDFPEQIPQFKAI